MSARPGDGLFRVAVIRHPLERLISAFKSKYVCDHLLKTPDSASVDGEESGSKTRKMSSTGWEDSESDQSSNTVLGIASRHVAENGKRGMVNSRLQTTRTTRVRTVRQTKLRTNDVRRHTEHQVFSARLRRDANISKSVIASSPPCMTIAEFAGLLDAIRRNVGLQGYVKTLPFLESHIVPQHHFLDFVAFDVVLDIRHWRDYAGATFSKRMPYAIPFNEDLKEEKQLGHHTGHLTVEMDDRTAVKLADFAALSNYGRLTYEMSN